jgi:hypothetical protein
MMSNTCWEQVPAPWASHHKQLHPHHMQLLDLHCTVTQESEVLTRLCPLLCLLQDV